MSKISDAAKAAAIMNFVSTSEDTPFTPEKAVELFDELASTFGPVDEVLEKYDCARWGLYNHWSDDDYWESIEMFASTIDAVFDHFEFPPKQSQTKGEA